MEKRIKKNLVKIADAISVLLRRFLSYGSDYAISSRIMDNGDKCSIALESSDEEGVDHQLYFLSLDDDSGLSIIISDYAIRFYSEETEAIRMVFSNFEFSRKE
jgi:hypothetical protein